MPVEKKHFLLSSLFYTAIRKTIRRGKCFYVAAGLTANSASIRIHMSGLIISSKNNHSNWISLHRSCFSDRYALYDCVPLSLLLFNCCSCHNPLLSHPKTDSMRVHKESWTAGRLCVLKKTVFRKVAWVKLAKGEMGKRLGYTFSVRWYKGNSSYL